LKRSPELKDALSKAINGEISGTKFLASIQDKDMHGAVKDFLRERYSNSMKLAKEIASNPNATKADLEFANGIRKNANRHIIRSYEMHLDPPKKGVLSWMKGGSMGRKLDMANRAETKIGDGWSLRPLSASEKA